MDIRFSEEQEAIRDGVKRVVDRFSSGLSGYSAASTLHLNLFGLHAMVVHGTPEQKERMLKPLISTVPRSRCGAYPKWAAARVPPSTPAPVLS